MLRYIVAPFLFLSAAWSAPAQQGGVALPGGLPRTAAPKATGRITGTVTCGDTHKPARGAMVMLLGDEKNPGSPMGNMSRTNLEGRYTLQHVAPGEYVVLAFFPGYALPLSDEVLGSLMDPKSKDAARQTIRALGVVSVADNGEAHQDVTLIRGGTLSGRVLYSDGSPAAQVQVDVQNVNAARRHTGNQVADGMDPAAMMRNLFSRQNPTTDDQGHFRISGLPDGTYRVAAVESTTSSDNSGEEAMGMVFGGMLGVNLDTTALRVYSGDTLHQKDAKTYDLRSGDEVPELTITIPLNAFHRVAGTLQAIDGRTLNFAQLTLTDSSDPSFTYHTTLKDDGTFSFPNVPEGTYSLSAVRPRIGVRSAIKGMENMPEQYWPMKPKAAFPDTQQSVLVKDADQTDLVMNLKEIPLPKGDSDRPLANTPFAALADSNDDEK